MFERFTDRARRVVILAQEEAWMLNHIYIGTEHILLGLIHEGEGVAAKSLESLGVSLEGIRSQVEEIVGKGQQRPTGHIPFTPRTKKVFELALREALQLGHNYIGTEHILLGLIREGEGVAAQVLVKLGVGLTRVREQVLQLLSGNTAKAPDEDQVLAKARTNVLSARKRHFAARDLLEREILNSTNTPEGDEQQPNGKLINLQNWVNDCAEGIEEAESLYDMLRGACYE